MVTRGSPKPLLRVRILLPLPIFLVRSAAIGSYFFVQLADNTSHLLQRVTEEMDVDIVGNCHIGMFEQF